MRILPEHWDEHPLVAGFKRPLKFKLRLGYSDQEIEVDAKRGEQETKVEVKVSKKSNGN